MKQSTVGKKHKTRKPRRIASAEYRWCKIELDRKQGNLLRKFANGSPLGTDYVPTEEREDEKTPWPILVFCLILLVPVIWSRTINCVYASSVPLLLTVGVLGVRVIQGLLIPDEGSQMKAIVDDDFFAESEPDATESMDSGPPSTRSRGTQR